ncbi:MAG TPA: potassium channel family protein, partial [Pyrinomonadaceae bacterium]|nr:potassium channel family protein [Pyrinomonadaceae bacterium]
MSLTSSLRSTRKNRANLRLAIVAVICAVAFGTVAFHQLEGWSILDSLYVTAQTVTTVGFGDLAPRTLRGRAFATG